MSKTPSSQSVTNLKTGLAEMLKGGVIMEANGC